MRADLIQVLHVPDRRIPARRSHFSNPRRDWPFSHLKGSGGRGRPDPLTFHLELGLPKARLVKVDAVHDVDTLDVLVDVLESVFMYVQELAGHGDKDRFSARLDSGHAVFAQFRKLRPDARPSGGFAVRVDQNEREAVNPNRKICRRYERIQFERARSAC